MRLCSLNASLCLQQANIAAPFIVSAHALSQLTTMSREPMFLAQAYTNKSDPGSKEVEVTRGAEVRARLIPGISSVRTLAIVVIGLGSEALDSTLCYFLHMDC